MVISRHRYASIHYSPGRAAWFHLAFGLKSIIGGLPFAAGELFVGSSQASQPFRGGTLLVGDIDQAIPLVLDGSGSVTYSLTLPNEPAAIGSEFFLQWWGLDPAGPSGYSSTNGLTYTLAGP